ncbi:MAG: hypothetical protein IT584_02955 [Chlamydiae bacterium]|nr:hypothetical protein [Chlamydiota bacterium]
MPTVSQLCKENFWKTVLAAKNSPVRAIAAASIALVTLSCLFPQGRACFRWSVTLVTSSGSAIFSRLSLFSATKKPEIQDKKEEEKSPKTEKKSVQESGESSDLFSQIVKNARDILEVHGRYSSSTEEISECVKKMSKDLQNRFLDDKEDLKTLCAEIEDSLYERARASLEEHYRPTSVATLMEWVEILANLNKKPNPCQQGQKIYDITKQVKNLLSLRKIEPNIKVLFPIVNFLVVKNESEWAPDFMAWLEKNEQTFLDVLTAMLQNQKHGILKLIILNDLTMEGYSIEEIDAANAYMIEFKENDPDLNKTVIPLWTRALDVLKTARCAEEALKEHKFQLYTYSFHEILFAANSVKASAGKTFKKRFENNPQESSEAVEGYILSSRLRNAYKV